MVSSTTATGAISLKNIGTNAEKKLLGFVKAPRF